MLRITRIPRILRIPKDSESIRQEELVPAFLFDPALLLVPEEPLVLIRRKRMVVDPPGRFLLPGSVFLFLPAALLRPLLLRFFRHGIQRRGYPVKAFRRVAPSGFRK